MTVAVITDLSDSPAVLTAAADLIEANGLHKWDRWPGAVRGEPWEPGMPLCALAALCMVCGKSEAGAIEDTPAVRALIAYITGNANAYVGFSAGQYRYYEVSNWADKRGTTQTDVVDALRKVADTETARIERILEQLDLESPASKPVLEQVDLEPPANAPVKADSDG